MSCRLRLPAARLRPGLGGGRFPGCYYYCGRGCCGVPASPAACGGS